MFTSDTLNWLKDVWHSFNKLDARTNLVSRHDLCPGFTRTRTRT